jgi:hypothetical protein
MSQTGRLSGQQDKDTQREEMGLVTCRVCGEGLRVAGLRVCLQSESEGRGGCKVERSAGELTKMPGDCTRVRT